MSYRFLFGGSGSGKTEQAFAEIIRASLKEPERCFFVLVPEQYSMLMQTRLLLMHPNRASENIDVLSFNRLAYRVFGERNIRRPEMMDDAGKAMILRKIAAARGKDLSVWKNQFRKPGFVSGMKSMISELYQYGITPDDLRKALQTDMKPLLRQKLSDMLVMYEGFADYIRDRFITTEELLDVFCRVLPDSSLLQNAVILLDGFTGFTPVQYRLIEQFLLMAEEVSFTVTVGDEVSPYRRGNREDLFFMSTDMTARITDLASRNGVSHGADIRLHSGTAPRFAGSPELDFLEKHFLRYDGALCEKKPEHIRLVSARNPQEEIAYAAGEILQLVKQEGFRYRDIAVIAGDLPGCGSELKHEFAVQGIPFYVDENLSIADNPLPELLRSAVGVLTDYYSGDSFLRFLKSGLAAEKSELLNLTENYMLECGIRGRRRLAGVWEYVPGDLRGTDMEALNAFKNAALELLEPLYEVFSGGSATVGAVTQVLRGLLEKTGAEQKLAGMCGAFRSAGDPGRVREYERVYPEVLRLFRQMEELLGDEPISREEYAGILDAGLNEIRVGVIPACADRVSIGDLKRSRLGRIRALFLLGANDGIIPKTGSAGGILTDREKESLKACGVELSPTTREDLYTQRYYLYRMLTQPEEKLYVSFSGTDRQGKALRMSGIVGRLRKLFPDLPFTAAGTGASQEVCSEEQARRLFIRSLGEIAGEEAGSTAQAEETFRKLYAWFAADPARKRQADSLTEAAAAACPAQPIGREAAERLYGSELTGSVTRLEAFADCPCAYFLKYGIGLCERRTWSVNAADIGTLTHDTIEIVFRRAREMKLELQRMDDAERDAFVEECAGEALLHDESGLFSDSARNRWIVRKLTRIAKRSIWVLAEQLKRGDFRPYLFEQKLSADEGLSSMQYDLPGGNRIRLTGRTDRVDICARDTDVLLKIIDYKTGSLTWEPYKLLSGREIQLILYLDAVSELLQGRFPGKEIIPAAVLYSHVDDPFINRRDITPAKDAALLTVEKMKPSGLVNADPEIMRHFDPNPGTIEEILPVAFKKDGTRSTKSSTADTERIGRIRAYVRKKIVETGTAILEGKNDASPAADDGVRNACTYCPFGAVCGFDRKTEGYAFRRERKLPPEEVWKIIEEQE